MASVPAPPPSRPSRTVTVDRGFLGALFAETSPLDLRIIGRTLLHAALVGAVAGLVAVLFFGGLELVESFLLGHLAGYTRLRAHGETMFGETEPSAFRPWLILVIPGLGALLGGMLTSRFAPEAQGGGGDAMIES